MVRALTARQHSAAERGGVHPPFSGFRVGEGGWAGRSDMSKARSESILSACAKSSAWPNPPEIGPRSSCGISECDLLPSIGLRQHTPRRFFAGRRWRVRTPSQTGYDGESLRTAFRGEEGLRARRGDRT